MGLNNRNYIHLKTCSTDVTYRLDFLKNKQTKKNIMGYIYIKGSVVIPGVRDYETALTLPLEIS